MGAEDVAARDKADSKVTSFLTAADGVTTIDNSDLDFAHTLDLLIGLVEDAIENQEYEQYAANLEGYELDEGDEDLISGRGFTEGARKGRPQAGGCAGCCRPSERGQIIPGQPYPRPPCRRCGRHAGRYARPV